MYSVIGGSVVTAGVIGVVTLGVCGPWARAQSAPIPAGGQPQGRMMVRNGPTTGSGESATGKAGRLDRYAAALGLDADQKVAATALYDAYTQNARQAGEKMRDAMKESKDQIHDGDMSGFQAVLDKAMKSQRAESKAAEKQFLDDLRALLTPAQEENWARFERTRRREQLMGSFGGVSGGGVDLMKLVDGLGLPADQKSKLGDALGMYDIDLDRVLLERQRLRQEMEEGDAAIGIGNAMHAPEKMMQVMEKQRELDVQVRDLNEKSARAMADALDEPWKQKLLDKVQQASFRAIYREAAVSKKIKAAQRLPDLTAKQKEQLKAIAEQYQKDAKPANDRWAAAQRKAETAGKADNFLMHVTPGMEGSLGNQDPALAEARTARRELDKSAREQMEKVLTPEQLASIPDPAQGGGAIAQTFTVHAMDHGDGNVVVVADGDDVMFDAEEMGDAPEGGVMIMRAVEVHSGGSEPGPVATPVPAPAPKP